MLFFFKYFIFSGSKDSEKPVPAGIKCPKITFSFRPLKKSVFLSIQLILKTTFVQGKKNLAREREREYECEYEIGSACMLI